MDALDLLLGPRGRRLCYELSRQITGVSPHIAGVSPQVAGASPQVTVVSRQTSGVSPQVTGPSPQPWSTAVDDEAALQAVADTCACARYWQPPDNADDYLLTGAGLAGIQDAAEALASSPATTWWASPLEIDDQHLVVFHDQAAVEPAPEPPLTGLRAAVDTLGAFHGSFTLPRTRPAAASTGAPSAGHGGRRR